MDQTDPKQQKAEELAQKAVANVMARIANVLTDEDLEIIEALEEKDKTGEAAKFFIVSKVPNFELLIKEELGRLILSNSA